MKSASGQRHPGEKPSPGEEKSRPQQCSEVWGEVEKKRCPKHSALTALTMRVKTAQIQKIGTCDARQNAREVQRTRLSALLNNKTMPREEACGTPPQLKTAANDGRSESSPLKLHEARSRLYLNQILQVNTHVKALGEIYTIHSFAPFSGLIFSFLKIEEIQTCCVEGSHQFMVHRR